MNQFGRRTGSLARNVIPGLIRENPIAAFGTYGAMLASRLAYKVAKREGMAFYNRVTGKKRPNVDHILDGPSQSPARGMPRRDPFGPPKKRYRPDPDNPSLPWLPKSRMKRNNAITGHYRKSKRRKRVQDPRGVVNVYDDHDAFTSDNALYLYAQDFGSSDRAIKIGVQAIVKAALATIFIHPTSPNFLITTGSPDNDLQIRFRRTVGVDPSYEDTTSQVTVEGQTFRDATDALFTLVKSRVSSGYFPYAFRFEGSDRGNEYRSLGDSIITMTASTTWQIQNTTVSDQDTAGVSNAHSITANPLKGKIYRTRGFVPYVRPSITRDEQAAVNFHESNSSGIQRPISLNGASYLNHPPVGTSFFRHCTASQNVRLNAGSIMPVRSYFKTKMTVLNYFKKVVINEGDGGQQPNMFGTCTVIGLEQAMRSVGDESVRVGVNREITMKAYVRLKTRVPTIHSYTSTGVLEGS